MHYCSHKAKYSDKPLSEAGFLLSTQSKGDIGRIISGNSECKSQFGKQ